MKRTPFPWLCLTAALSAGCTTLPTKEWLTGPSTAPPRPVVRAVPPEELTLQLVGHQPVPVLVPVAQPTPVIPQATVVYPNGSVVQMAVPVHAGATCACDNGCKEEKGPKTIFEWSAGQKKEKKKKSKKENGDKKENGNGDKKDEEKKNGNGDKKEGEEGKKENGNGDKKEGENGDKKNGNGDKKDEEKKNGNGNGDKKDEEDEDEDEDEDEMDEPEEDRIETDRPDFTEASTTVGKGRIQLEAGYTFIRDRNQGTSLRAHSYPEMLWRIGMFAEWFELRIGQNFATETVTANGIRTRTSGAEDLYLGTKIALTEQKKCLPEMALIFQMTAPTGVNAYTARQVLPGFNLLYAWDVLPDCLSMGGSFQINRSIDDVDHYYTEVAQSFTIGYDLTRDFAAYTEWFAFYPCGAIGPETTPQHFANGGFTYKLGDNIQFDIRAGVGLNRRADDFFIGSGFAVRY